ncbi:MAG: hypothetical protein AW09_001050 [Candidatus Accumulibacter phosphatis]|uniref:Uncharacterized protein n=1 Tax=Candidatus Accumulibacter phosphatis TaxID=327160 RepID=A0A080LXQ8_9PROT|nr:MAG: hypothetical protein AW09_001050 [Candidatus Accumulibacter phosphatis]
MVAKAVLLRVHIVGVSRTEGLGKVAVVLAALILIADQKGNRRARAPTGENSRQNLYGIGLAPLRHMPRSSRLAAIEFGLNVGLADRKSRRAAIDHAADRRPV